MEYPKFSIIIPTFNAAATLTDSIESIIAQTYPNFEIIIVDGGSDDDTLSVVAKYSSFISVRLSGPDQGVYDAMNKGVRAAKGDWVYFLGADDKLFDHTVLRKVAETISKTSVDFLYGNVLINGNCSWASDNSVYDGEFTVSKLFSKNICHQAIFYARHLFQKLGLFNINYPVCADWDFNHRCFGSSRVAFIDQTIAVFSAGGKSSQQHRDRFREDSVINLRKYYGVNYSNRLFSKHAEIFLINANRFFRDRKYFHSIYYFAFSIFHSPNRLYYFKKYVWMILNTFKRHAVVFYWGAALCLDTCF